MKEDRLLSIDDYSAEMTKTEEKDFWRKYLRQNGLNPSEEDLEDMLKDDLPE